MEVTPENYTSDEAMQEAERLLRVVKDSLKDLSTHVADLSAAKAQAEAGDDVARSLRILDEGCTVLGRMIQAAVFQAATECLEEALAERGDPAPPSWLHPTEAEATATEDNLAAQVVVEAERLLYEANE